MNKITAFAIGACLFGAPICDAHAGSSTSGVFGFLSSNGTFRPLPAATPRPKAAATVLAGRLVANFGFAIASSIPTTAPILCGLQGSLFGIDAAGVSDVVLETDQATAARSGSHVTCQVAIPYTWTLSVPASDTVTLSGSATAVNTTGKGRTSSFQLETIAVPATGKITTITYSGKL